MPEDTPSTMIKDQRLNKYGIPILGIKEIERPWLNKKFDKKRVFQSLIETLILGAELNENYYKDY